MEMRQKKREQLSGDFTGGYMNHITDKNNFSYFFFSLIALLFSAAVVAELHTTPSEGILSLTTLLMLIMSAKSLKTDITWKWIVYVLIILFIIFEISEKIFEYKSNVYIILLLLLIFFIGSFVVAAKQVLFVGEIDWNSIIGSLTLYLLLGLIWTIIYLIILVMDPQALAGIETASWQQMFSRVAYYSFVTLTTLGYGDILPKNYIAEFFVYMEAIVGVFYMAIVVSSLINIHLNIAQEKRSKK